jgi:hypothetical protein
VESKIEQLILSHDFPYLQPYFYNHPWALRCRLGRGRTPEEFAQTARERAEAIYRILFPTPADAVIFSYWIYDRSFTGDPGTDHPAFRDEARRWLLETQLRQEANQLRFLDAMQSRYRHAVVRDLPVYDEGPERDHWRHRIVCWPDAWGFDDLGLLRRQLVDEPVPLEISLVSFANECILSVYDHRGCDVVFADHASMLRFYARLEPFFLAYDAEEMARRAAAL